MPSIRPGSSSPTPESAGAEPGAFRSNVEMKGDGRPRGRPSSRWLVRNRPGWLRAGLLDQVVAQLALEDLAGGAAGELLFAELHPGRHLERGQVALHVRLDLVLGDGRPR